jgi:diguanylate cyclase (GGDEF)-like protein
MGWRWSGIAAVRWILGTAFCLGLSPARALDPDTPLAEFTLSTWTRADGLPHNFVIDLEQSSEGYLWLATWRGAVRFNGREFEVFDQQRLPWNEDGSVWKLARTRDGSLLLGSQRFGLSRQRDGKFRHEWQPEQPALLLSVVEDTRGRLWVGTRDGAIRLDGENTRRFGVADGLPDGAAQSMGAAANGVVWIGTAEGAARIDGDLVTSFGTEQGLPPGEIGMVLVSHDDTVRVGTKRGVYRLAGERFEPELAALPADEVSALLEDRHGALWVGTVGHGVFRASGRGVESLNIDQGLPSAHINTLLEDDQGNVWIGTHGGLSQLRETRFATYSIRDGLADDFVRSMVEDAAGSVWIASNGGVSRIRAGRIESVATQFPDAALSTLSMRATRNGELWFGTYRDGARRLDATGMHALTRADGLAGEEVRSIIEAADGSIWLGLASGLTHWTQGHVRSWSHVHGEPNQLYVRSLLESRSGRIYIGTPQGLAWADGETIERLPLPDGRTINVFGLHECAHGHLWALGSGGLWRLREGGWRELAARHDLTRSTVFGMIADDEGNDWLSTAQGLVKVNHGALERALEDPTTELALARYGDGPGSEGFSLNGGSTPSMLRTGDGRIWLASGQGAVVFDPRKLDEPVSPPPTVIERILVDGAEHDAANSNALAPGTRRIEFDFAGLSFLAPESIRYRHRLLGFDAQWSAAARAASASYTNLPPGRYRFEVEALVAGARDAPRVASHEFDIQPFLHQRTSFRIGLLALLALLGTWWFRWRTRALRRQAIALQALIDERTHELSVRSNRLEQADREKAGLIVLLQEQSAQLARHAQEDGLTGLSNRRELDRALTAALAEANAMKHPVALALIDVDHFKRINDRCGHGTGDEVLRRVAEVLRAISTGSTVVGRYGGEEFALVMPECELATASALCEQVRTEVADAARTLDLSGLPLTVSIGVAAVSGMDPAQAYAAADRRLYEAKRGGRDRVQASAPPP